MSASQDRRKSKDRRGRDIGPPAAWDDRRKKVERRLPTAEETEMTAEEFAMYFGKLPAIREIDQHLLDKAAEVFDCVRSKF
jgi:hypothetical protein